MKKSNLTLLALCVATFAMPLFIKGAFLGGANPSANMLSVANGSTLATSLLLLICTMVAIMFRQNDAKAKDKTLDTYTAYASLFVALAAPALMFWIFYADRMLAVYLIAAILIGNGFHGLICFDRYKFIIAYALLCSLGCFLSSQLFSLLPFVHTSNLSPIVALITGVTVIIINAIVVGRVILKERRHGKR